MSFLKGAKKTRSCPLGWWHLWFLSFWSVLCVHVAKSGHFGQILKVDLSIFWLFDQFLQFFEDFFETFEKILGHCVLLNLTKSLFFFQGALFFILGCSLFQKFLGLFFCPFYNTSQLRSLFFHLSFLGRFFQKLLVGFFETLRFFIFLVFWRRAFFFERFLEADLIFHFLGTGRQTF